MELAAPLSHSSGAFFMPLRVFWTEGRKGAGPHKAVSQHILQRLKVVHKFKVGQQVEYSPPRGNYAPRGMYIVTKLLPESHGEFEYFIRSAQEGHERIAKESEPSGVPGG
jgi:hypothetical protein